jgi:hypothetical protein
MTKYSDLQNDGLPVEERLNHLEREAGFVRDRFKEDIPWMIVSLSLGILSLALSVVALIITL